MDMSKLYQLTVRSPIWRSVACLSMIRSSQPHKYTDELGLVDRLGLTIIFGIF